MTAIWARLGLWAKFIVILLTVFVASNFAFYLTGSSPYTMTDMLGLLGIFVAGLVVIVISDRIFQACWPSKDS